MPPVNWGISADAVDDFEMDDRYTPYMGPTNIPLGVYIWRIAVMQRKPRTEETLPQLRVGLELVPRNKDERKFKGFFVMDFIPVSDRTNFRYAPLLQILGVSGRDFTKRLIYDADGNIKKIGPWRMDGQTLIAAQLGESKKQDANGNTSTRKEIKGYYPVPDDVDMEDEEDDEEYDEFDDSDVDYVDDVDGEEERPKRGRGAVGVRNRGAGTGGKTTRSRRTSQEDSEDEDDYEEEEKPRRSSTRRTTGTARKPRSSATTTKRRTR